MGSFSAGRRCKQNKEEKHALSVFGVGVLRKLLFVCPKVRCQGLSSVISEAADGGVVQEDEESSNDLGSTPCKSCWCMLF